MSNTKSKLEIVLEILMAAELDPNGECSWCGAIEDECECFAGVIRATMAENPNNPFFPSDEVCMQMYAEHFGLDALGEQYFNDLMDWTDAWVENNIDGDGCDYPECNECNPPETKSDSKLN